MKKLMVVVAAVAMAVSAQAYNVTWGLSNMDGSTFTDWNGTSIDSDGGGVTGYVLALTGEGAGATFSEGAFNIGTAQIVDSSAWDGDLSGWGNAAAGYTDSTVSNLGNQQQYFQIVLTDGDLTNLADGKHVYILAPEMIEGVDPAPGGTNWSYDQLDMTTSVVKDNWNTVGAVPEPTSGLLLLIGVAGLALRRRRA